MKGIILAGGAGKQLYPLTLVAIKQLQPVFDKPMIYYPLTTLIENGVNEICVISTPQDLQHFEELLGDGSQFGVSISYRVQRKPEGIAQAFLIAESFINEEPCTLILGDNVFWGGEGFASAFSQFSHGASIFAYQVTDPERYGVLEFDDHGHVVSIEEKPKSPKGNYAIPGLYIFDSQVVRFAKSLVPSPRGELEIADLINVYLARQELKVTTLVRGSAWLDAGTSSSLHEASAYVQTIEKRQGIKVGCPEEAALRRGFLTLEQFTIQVKRMPRCEYREYLMEVVAETARLRIKAA